VSNDKYEEGLRPIWKWEIYAQRCTCKPEHCYAKATSCLAFGIKNQARPILASIT